MSDAVVRHHADELAAARETIRRLNRRCQQAEAAADKKLEAVRQGLLEDVSARPAGRTLGRMLANYAAARSRDLLANLVHAVESGDNIDAALEEAKKWLNL